MNDDSTCVFDNVTGNEISDQETTHKDAIADEASPSCASDARDTEVIGVCTSESQDDNYHDGIVPSVGKMIQKPLQSLKPDVIFPHSGQVNTIPEKMLKDRNNVCVVNDAKEKLKREEVRGGTGPFHSSHFESNGINCDKIALKKMILETDKAHKGSKMDTKNPKLASAVKHTKVTDLLNKEKKNLMSSSYSTRFPVTGNGCPHSLFLHRKDDGNGQQALGAPKINTQLGKYFCNVSRTNTYIR